MKIILNYKGHAEKIALNAEFQEARVLVLLFAYKYYNRFSS